MTTARECQSLSLIRCVLLTSKISRRVGLSLRGLEVEEVPVWNRLLFPLYSLPLFSPFFSFRFLFLSLPFPLCSFDVVGSLPDSIKESGSTVRASVGPGGAGRQTVSDVRPSWVENHSPFIYMHCDPWHTGMMLLRKEVAVWFWAGMAYRAVPYCHISSPDLFLSAVSYIHVG